MIELSGKKELIIFTGNVGCGKSLLASKLAKKGYVVVNNDAITNMVQGGEYGLYDTAKKPIYRDIEVVAIKSALQAGFSVVVDRTNMKISDRERYIKIGKENDAYIRSFTWGPGLNQNLTRRLRNDRGEPSAQWSGVFYHMKNSYELPLRDEGFDELINLETRHHLTFHAFDFDGTIVENKFPAIGKIKERTVKIMQDIWEDMDNIIIIWTCRDGDYLNEMRSFLIKQKIFFDFINENPLVDFGSAKIFAHNYYDDRNVFVDF